MKKTRKGAGASRATELRSEYTFDYSRGRKNRFASKERRPTVAVVLAPDVARVFDTSRRTMPVTTGRRGPPPNSPLCSVY